ncbi:sulfite exporter TauE/SafE family protein [Humidisolicoccus flavus]|uniref:sulfite exporter TauE/SafE family protein n=1 Tax=Humidisolicoccus flavus TaxID=3111414 RepID=UPI00324C1F05
MTQQERRPYIRFILIGMAAGFLSGMFGIGGGILIVPALLWATSLSRKQASGTSLAAIVPVAAVGVVSYAIAGAVDLLVAAILAAGAIVGAQIGTWLLERLSNTVIRWAFIVFLIVMVVQLFLTVPDRDSDLTMSFITGAGLVALGVLTGVLSGLLGVGGGIVVVPILIVVFGASDLVAKGTSLLMMIPTAVSGTIANARRKNVDLVAAVIIGVAACAITPLGALLAVNLDPEVANYLLAALIIVIAIRMIIEAITSRKK